MSALNSGPKNMVIRDSTWVSKMFLVNHGAIESRFQMLSIATTAHSKYTGTRIGDNWAINNPPHYTRHADPRVTSLVNAAGEVATTGMGQFYSEQLDDTAHLVHMCFGHANFRGMLAFFTGMGDIKATMYARTGRISVGYLLGKAVGIYVGLRFLPLMIAGMAAKYVLNRGTSKYYNFRPAMHSYWKRVNFIANSFAVSLGLYQRIPNWGQKEFEKEMHGSYPGEEDDLRQLIANAHAASPEIFKRDGGVDIYQMAMKHQKLAHQRRLYLRNLGDRMSGSGDPAALWKTFSEYEYRGGGPQLDPTGLEQAQRLEELLREVHQEGTGDTQPIGSPSFSEDGWEEQMLARGEKIISMDNTPIITAQTEQEQGLSNTGGDYPPDVPPPDLAQTQNDGTVQPETSTVKDWINDPSNFKYMGAFSMYYFQHDQAGEDGQASYQAGWMKKWVDSIKASYHGSYEWVSFRVNPSGSVSSSFSNSSRESDISSMINGFSSTLAGHRFTFSNGATGLPLVDGVITQIRDGLNGMLDGLGVMGIINLAGSSYVDIPEHWDSSSATFPSESFKIELRSVYANRLSRFMAMYVPTSMVLAGGLPLSAGKQSYTSPYMCQVYSPGRMSCKLGMIDSLNIEIGVGNIGYNQDNQPLGFDVSWTVKDMNKVMHAPIDIGGGINPFRGIFDDDNAFNDYLNVLSAVSMADQIMPLRRLSHKFAIRMNQWDSFWSVGNFSMGAMDTSVGRLTKSVVNLAAIAGVGNLQPVTIDRSNVR